MERGRDSKLLAFKTNSTLIAKLNAFCSLSERQPGYQPVSQEIADQPTGAAEKGRMKEGVLPQPAGAVSGSPPRRTVHDSKRKTLKNGA